MTAEWKPKPIAEIPQFLCQMLMGRDDGGLYVSFWEGDDEAGLHLLLTQDQIREIEDYGVTDELIDWMRDNEEFERDLSPDNDGWAYTERFSITDEVVARFYARQGES